ncbi:MAG: Ig-like domain-containing protein, partial [Leptospiraceae bacterium]|nr:Ig-like domain-containing protein [Leptospiraceae bacterium]
MLKSANWKKGFLISLLFWIASCGDAVNTGSAISQLVPLALRGDANGVEYTEPGNSINSELISSTSPVTLYQADAPASVCAGGIKEPGTDFGMNGPEAFITLCSDDEVDRYRNIEIRFSESMEKSTVEAAFSMTKEGSTLPGPSPGGTFIWKSPRRLYFDPYRELDSLSNYTITISSSAKTFDGNNLKSFSKSFKASHDYLMESSITQGATTITLNQQKDITFSKTGGDLILNTSWLNSVGIDTTVTKVILNKIGNVVNGTPNSSAKVICNENCSGTPISVNLSTDAFFQNSPLSLTEGGNTYYYEITSLSGNKYQRFFSFNWGNVTNPNNLQQNAASAVLDENQMMKMLERLIEVFAEQKFKVTNKTFNEFAQNPVSNARNTTKCIDYKAGQFNYISTYGDNPSGGYCGPDGNTGRFVGTYNGILTFWSDSHFDMDVYVTNVSLPGSTNGSPTVDALMKVNGEGELGVDLGSRKAYVSLAVIARNRTNIALLIGGGSKFYFTTTIELNKSPTPTNIRNARAKAGLSVNGSGDLAL